LALFLVSLLWVLDVENELKELALFLVSWLWVLGVNDLELVQEDLRSVAVDPMEA